MVGGGTIMTIEEIMKIIENKSNIVIGPTCYVWCEIHGEDIFYIANELFELIEQEKKATIKLILLGFQCALDDKQPERAVEETILRIVERYGVEL